MARKDLQPLHDPFSRYWQSLNPEKDDVSTFSPLSGEHEVLLDYYFAEPTSTKKPVNDPPLHLRSKW